ncbi:MAG TPA: DUF4410 domain-containing protein [Candidatus Binataceae bacterium]|nr:DUF4410 domain-containing protein [Candidatus Binataceae bacterium]
MPLFLLACAVAVAGCAGAKVTEQSQSAPVIMTRPDQIVVYPFAVDANDVTLNQGFLAKRYRQLSGENSTAEQSKIAHDTAHNVCVRVAANLSEKGYKAVCQDRGTPVVGSNVIAIDGEFTDVSEGNRARRMIIGLGVGAAVIDANVQVYQRTEESSQQIMQFATHADSGEMPGAGITGPAGAAAGGAAAIASAGVNVAAAGAKSVTSSTGFLADKTAGQIVDQLTRYYAQQGWAPVS